MNRPRLDHIGEILHAEAGLADFVTRLNLNPDNCKATSLLELLVRSDDVFDLLSRFRMDVRAEALMRNGGFID
jgi:hypothetical protein